PDERIVGVAAYGELNRVGNHLARGQGGFHAFVTHGNAVGHRYGAELARSTAGRGNTLLDRLGLAHERDIAGRSLVPAAGHPDKRLMDLLAGEPHRIIVGAMRGALRTL